MNKEQYNLKLKEVGLSKKELSRILGVAEQTVNNWGSTNKVPYWIETWLENYIEKQKHKKMVDILKDSGVCG